MKYQKEQFVIVIDIDLSDHQHYKSTFRITHLAHEKSYLVIICPNSHAKLTKSEIRSSSSWFKHCSESFILPIGRHIWSLFAPIHMKGWPKVKLGKVQVGSNIAQNLSLQPIWSYIWSWFAPIHMKSWSKVKLGSHICSLLAPIHMKSWPKVKLGKVQVGLNIAQNHSSNP